MAKASEKDLLHSLDVSMQLNDELQDLGGLELQVKAKRRSKRSSWEIDYYLEDLVWKLRFLVEEFERTIAPIEAELCRLAKEFTEFPEPRYGCAKVRARGREYEYQVLYLQNNEFTKARKIYLTSDRRRELAIRYEAMYRKIADLLRAVRTYCQSLELQDTAKPREEDQDSLESSIELNQDERDQEL